MSHVLLIHAKIKSEAKIMGMPVKALLEGETYRVAFLIVNLGKDSFPGGNLTVIVEWPTTQVERFATDIPEIPPNKSRQTEEMRGIVMSRGFGLFSAYVSSSDSKPVRIFKNPKKPVGVEGESFQQVKGKTHEEIYEFWGMMVAAISLFIIALEKIVQFFLWLSSILPS